MEQRELTDCGKCGQQVEIVPAGISKTKGRTINGKFVGNPYGAFYACKSCGFRKSMSEKPRVDEKLMVALARGEYKDVDAELLGKITRIEKGVEAIWAKLQDVERAVNFSKE